MAVEKMNNVTIMERQIRVSLSAAPSSLMGMMPMMGGAAMGAVPPPPPGMPPPGGVDDWQGGMHPVLDKEETERSGVTMTAMGRSSLMAKLAARGDAAPGVPPPPATAPPPPAAPAPPEVVESRQFMLNNMFDPSR